VSHRVLIVALVAVVVMVAGVGALYQWLVPGLSSARTEQGRVESGIATWLLHRSVPVQAKARTNPLANDPAEIAAGSAGRYLFQLPRSARYGESGNCA
jgi:hypothetical protein